MTKPINKIVTAIRSTRADNVTFHRRLDTPSYLASSDTTISYADLLALCDEIERLQRKERLNESIEKAAPNLSKITDVDAWCEEVRGGPVFGTKGILE